MSPLLTYLQLLKDQSQGQECEKNSSLTLIGTSNQIHGIEGLINMKLQVITSDGVEIKKPSQSALMRIMNLHSKKRCTCSIL